MELSRNLRIDSVSRLQPTAPHHVPDSATVACLLVVREGKLVGIFTERDLLVRVLASGKPLSAEVRTVMTADPVTVRPKDPIRAAVKKMVTGGYRHLPIVDEDNRPVGVLSAKRVVHYLAEHFPDTVFNQPDDPSRVPDTAEGA
jgi:CBS domain-containing protein